jgi:hypothetical protein
MQSSRGWRVLRTRAAAFGRTRKRAAADPKPDRDDRNVAFALVPAGRLRATAFVAKESSRCGGSDDCCWAKARAERICSRPSLPQARASRCMCRCTMTRPANLAHRGVSLRVTKRSSRRAESVRCWCRPLRKPATRSLRLMLPDRIAEVAALVARVATSACSPPEPGLTADRAGCRSPVKAALWPSTATGPLVVVQVATRKGRAARPRSWGCGGQHRRP